MKYTISAGSPCSRYHGRMKDWEEFQTEVKVTYCEEDMVGAETDRIWYFKLPLEASPYTKLRVAGHLVTIEGE